MQDLIGDVELDERLRQQGEDDRKERERRGWDGNQTTGPKGMRLDRHLLYCCCLCWKPTKRNESDEFGNTRNNRFLGFLLLVGGAGFPSLAPSN